MDLDAALRSQAEACGRLGSPMYADLLARVADDVVAGGPAASVLSGHEDAPGPTAVALRLAGSVHRLVLERRAGALATYYPSVGGTFEPDACWTSFRALLEDRPDAVREWLDRPPQTNEVGRAAALMAGLIQLSADTQLPIRLREIGSSGGLNLLADRFGYGTGHEVLGEVGSPVLLEDAWRGDGPWGRAWPAVVDRLGSDVMPVDVATTEGRLTLTAYVWPDQSQRHERLRGALQLAAQTPVPVVCQGAGDFLDALDLAEGTLTVLWHSVMWQYLPASEQQRVSSRLDELGESATHGAPFAHLSLEPVRREATAEHRFWLVVRLWPGGERRFLARAHPHGPPIDWSA